MLTYQGSFFHDRLKPIDIVVLKKLSEVVNVVPVIAKSDSLTFEERDAFRQRVSIFYDLVMKCHILIPRDPF